MSMQSYAKPNLEIIPFVLCIFWVFTKPIALVEYPYGYATRKHCVITMTFTKLGDADHTALPVAFTFVRVIRIFTPKFKT